MDYAMENSMRWLGPVFVFGAVSLISMCIWAFLGAVFGEVRMALTLLLFMKGERFFCSTSLARLALSRMLAAVDIVCRKQAR